MKKFTPHVWLAGNMVLFGFVTIMQGLVKSYSGLLATRFFLGVFGELPIWCFAGYRVQQRVVTDKTNRRGWHVPGLLLPHRNVV
jgi:hypothetical protein